MARTRTTARSAALRVLAGATVLAAVAACTGEPDGATPTTVPATTTTVVTRADDGRLVLGAYLPRTGPGAVLGTPMIEAIDQAVRDINTAGGVLDQPVDLKIVDENSGAGMIQLVDDDVDAIVGPASSRVALAELDDITRPGNAVVTCSPTATAMALDDYPDNNYFFRTIASDSFVMGAIARRVANTGVNSVALAYLDDPYGRPLRDMFAAEAAARAISVETPIGFSADELELDQVAEAILASTPSVVVVLGDADDGTRLLTALDAATAGTEPPLVIVNEALRDGRQTVQSLSSEFRDQVIGVAARARAAAAEFDGFYTANAVDCVNLIALSAVQAQSDSPKAIQAQMAAVSDGGRQCISFADCVEKLGQGLQINYNGLSGSIELSSTTGDLTRSWFEVFTFDEEGVDEEAEIFQMP